MSNFLNIFASPGPKRSAPMAQMEDSGEKPKAANSVNGTETEEPRGIKRKKDPYDVPSPEPAPQENHGFLQSITSAIVRAATPSKRNGRRSIGVDEEEAEEAQTPTRSAGRASSSVTPVEKMAPSPRKSQPRVRKSITPRQASAKRQKRESILAETTAGVEEEEEEEEEKKKLEAGADVISALIGHRKAKDGDDIEIEVQWEGDDDGTTWEPEVNLQEDAPDSLYEYWKNQGGRSNAVFHAKGAPLKSAGETYHVFKILQFEKRGPKFFLKTQWVGYPPHEFSWEPESKLNKTAPQVVEEFWTSKGGRDQHVQTRGRGRPKKNKGKK